MKTTALLMMLALFANAAWAADKSRVVIVQDAAAVSGWDVDAGRVRVMVSRGIQKLTGQNTDAAAWSVFAGKDDVVGIKINTRAAPLQIPHAELLAAIMAGLQAGGVTTNNIIVWDVDPSKLRSAGYPFGTRSVIEDTGWDAEKFYDSKIVGKLIWGDLDFSKETNVISDRSHLPRLLTRTITKLINVPVLLDHDVYGLSGCLHNISVAAVDNARRFEVAGGGDSAIIDINALPAVKEKLVLNIMDGLVGGYAGGPSFKPQYSWPAGELLFSRDPVAVDSLCLEQLEKKRVEAHVPAIGARAAHITVAGKMGLGVAEREKVELLEVTP